MNGYRANLYVRPYSLAGRPPIPDSLQWPPVVKVKMIVRDVVVIGACGTALAALTFATLIGECAKLVVERLAADWTET